MLKTGEILKKTREEKNLTIEEIEKQTSIRKKHLLAVEESHFDTFSSITYVLGVVRSYAKYLGLDEAKMTAYFKREYEGIDETDFKKKLSLDSFTPTTKKTLSVALIFIFLIFGGYFIYQLNLYFSPPEVKIIEPQRTEFRTDKVNLIGETGKEVAVSVNGRQIFVDEEGRFETSISLIDEKNDVTIEAVGANGKRTVVKKVFIKKK